jgi:hypothetical protein
MGVCKRKFRRTDFHAVFCLLVDFGTHLILWFWDVEIDASGRENMRF